jgi:DNA repair exonuclease SbcCD ATPase subunit
MEKENQMYEIRDERTEYNNDYNKFKNYQIELEQYKNQRLELENKNLLIEQKLVKYKEYIESISSIEQKEKNVKILENDLVQIETKIMKFTNNITNLTNIIKLLETEEIKQKKIIKKYHSLEAYKNIIQIYPSYLTNQIIEQFEMLINSFLAKIMNFTLQINYNDKELIITKIDQYKNEYLSSTLSGAETFIVSCAIRFALIRISKIAMCSSFCIDEGFGSLDENKIYEFKNKIFEFLTKQFHNVIVVTHIDEIKNCLNHIIEVTDDNDKKIRIYKNR